MEANYKVEEELKKLQTERSLRSASFNKKLYIKEFSIEFPIPSFYTLDT